MKETENQLQHLQLFLDRFDKCDRLKMNEHRSEFLYLLSTENQQTKKFEKYLNSVKQRLQLALNIFYEKEKMNNSKLSLRYYSLLTNAKNATDLGNFLKEVVGSSTKYSSPPGS